MIDDLLYKRWFSTWNKTWQRSIIESKISTDHFWSLRYFNLGNISRFLHCRKFDAFTKQARL